MPSSNHSTRTAARRRPPSRGDSNSGTRRLRLPVIHTEVPVPDSGAFYYAGVGAMAALDFIDWPVALVIAAGHLIAERSKDRAVKEIGEGVSAGG